MGLGRQGEKKRKEKKIRRRKSPYDGYIIDTDSVNNEISLERRKKAELAPRCAFRGLFRKEGHTRS
jgi:hypothetical protein